MRFLFLFVIFNGLGLNLFCSESSFKSEGYYTDYNEEKRFQLISLFLPYNPNVLIFDNSTHCLSIGEQRWPLGVFFAPDSLLKDQHLKYDFLWIDSLGTELQILKNSSDTFKQASVIYTTTNLSKKGVHYLHLKRFLESSGFIFLSHWYLEDQNGHAIFLRKDIFDASMRSLNYSPTVFPSSNFAYPHELEKFFRRAENKSQEHRIDQIDFIYMINLDERPEKFALAAGDLKAFGISPYRFSAINGWKLTSATFNQIGVKFSPGTIQEKLRGSIFKEIDGREYVSNEFIEANGETYFALGMVHGSIGIVLSHLSVLQDAYDSGFHTIWVMEDDVDIIEDPRQIPELIKKLDKVVDDWDILFTDIDTKDSKGNHVPCRSIAARPNVALPPLASFYQLFYPVNEDFSRIGMRYGAYSMIIRRSGMEKILRYFTMYGIFLPYDMDFWLVPELKMYSVNKDIISHRAGALSDNGAPNYLKKNIAK